MDILTVNLGKCSYPIMLGSRTEWMQELLKLLAGRSALIVTDEHVDAAGHLEQLEQVLSGNGFTDFHSLILPPGEEYKNLSTVENILRTAVNAGLDRKSCMIALSGGVTGDMTGFAAAIYMRGIDFIQLPTTLLAAVDSSVGGKTGADLPEGKNLVGSFHQPQMVALDVQTLSTLPEKEWRNGLAEVVKYGMIMDENFLSLLEDNVDKLNCFEPDFYQSIIRRCCACKAEVVAADEHENGRRAILNYGHTTGHAVEKLSDYTLPHGQAVAIGMAAAARLAVRMNMIDASVEQRQNELLKALKLPVKLPQNSSVKDIVRLMHSDKKNISNHITMVLPTAPGQVEIVRNIDETILADALSEVS